MENAFDKPLVTISMVTYNQENYIRESIRSVLSQTYEPLEIVISDDHSTDRTWEIILEEIDHYRRTNGVHKKFVLNRNETNLGIARNCNIAASLHHGLLYVANDGDDISFPNRVERIVEEWNKTGRCASVVTHDGIKIDRHGREIGTVGQRGIQCPLGAVMTFSSSVINDFEGIQEIDSYVDHVYARRGGLLGTELFINEKLLKYRVGSGTSSVLYSRRQPELRAAKGRMASYCQSLHDIDLFLQKKILNESRYLELRKEYESKVCENEHIIELLSDSRFIDRWKAYRKLYLSGRIGFSAFLRFPYLLPRKLGDLCYWLYGCLKNG